MKQNKTKKLLFTFSVILASLPLAGCKDEPKSEPIVVDCLKNGLIALNSTDNYTMNCSGNRIAEHSRVYLKDSISLFYKDNKSYDKIYYQDGDKGVYSIGYNGQKYVASSYYSNMPKDVWSGKYFSTMKGVETDFVNAVDKSAVTLKIINKSYRTAFLKTVGYSAIDYVNLDELTASYNNGKLYFKMNFKNVIFNFVFSDFGSSTNTVLNNFFRNGGKPHQNTAEQNDIVSKMKSNNYAQEIFQFGETPETTGYIGKNYFNPNYFYTNYTGSLLATGHVALDGRESASGTYRDIYGCYQFLLDYSQEKQEDILTLFPTRFSDEPDIPTFYNYPSNMMILDHMEYLLDWDRTIFPTIEYILYGKGFCITDPTMVYDIQNNFGIFSSFDGAVPVAVGIDYYVQDTVTYIIFVCKFSYGGYNYYMPFPFYDFGNIKDQFLEAAIAEMKK